MADGQVSDLDHHDFLNIGCGLDTGFARAVLTAGLLAHIYRYPYSSCQLSPRKHWEFHPSYLCLLAGLVPCRHNSHWRLLSLLARLSRQASHVISAFLREGQFETLPPRSVQAEIAMVKFHAV